MPAESPYIDADAQEVVSPGPAEEIEDQYLTARAGTNLRQAAVTPKGRAKTWRDAVDAFEGYIWDEWKSAQTWDEEKDVRPTSHRFTPSASKDRYGRTLGGDRAARRLWGDAVTTVHVVRRARAFGVDGQPQPPADHLADLLAGNSNVYRAYRRHIGDEHGLTYARLSVLEPHRNGYGHVHDALWIHDPEDTVQEADIYPAIDAHLRAVQQAQSENHGPGTVSVEHDPETVSRPSDPDDVPPTTALPREVTKFLGGLAPHESGTERTESVPNVLQTNRGPLRFYALLWATGTRQWRPDREVFPHLVKASQTWYGDDDGVEDDGTYPSPEDLDTARSDGVPTVDVSARAVDFEPVDGGVAEM